MIETCEMWADACIAEFERRDRHSDGGGRQGVVEELPGRYVRMMVPRLGGAPGTLAGLTARPFAAWQLAGCSPPMPRSGV